MNDEPDLTLGDRIKSALRRAGKTQTALAKACGINPTSVNDWISGKSRSMNSVSALRAARFLGVRSEWLINGRGDQATNEAKEDRADYAAAPRDPILDDLDALLPEDADIWRAQIRAAAIKERRRQTIDPPHESLPLKGSRVR